MMSKAKYTKDHSFNQPDNETGNRKYYIDNSIESDEQWKFLLNLVFKVADTIEFNILMKSYKSILDKELLSEVPQVFPGKTGKIYSTSKYIQFPLTDVMRNFMLLKKYSEWYNYCIEDPAFLKEGKELLATITHENYVIMLLSEEQRGVLNSKGFNFDVEWILPY